MLKATAGEDALAPCSSAQAAADKAQGKFVQRIAMYSDLQSQRYSTPPLPHDLHSHIHAMWHCATCTQSGLLPHMHVADSHVDELLVEVVVTVVVVVVEVVQMVVVEADYVVVQVLQLVSDDRAPRLW